MVTILGAVAMLSAGLVAVPTIQEASAQYTGYDIQFRTKSGEQM
jgi:hypothetical protein